jgi:translation initiation factor IF-2
VEAAAQIAAPPVERATAVMEPEAVPAPATGRAPVAAPSVEQPRRLELKFPITVKDLAAKMDVKAHELIKTLMQQGVFASILQPLEEEAARRAAGAFHHELAPQPTLEEQLHALGAPNPERLIPAAPVVTLMGHVDHGKTSLLDAIREAKVASQEAGGITQHIGAYEVLLEKGRVTFLDTPGHEAFTALRARGANVTDIVVLVVAADDGMMPQTVEAIDHAKAADVPIVVAINKVDKPEANVQKVKQQLSQHGLISEEWGGKTIMVPVSAKTRQGVNELLDMLLLEAELLELKVDPSVPAQGTVIEAKQTRDRGPVATVLVQQGTLRMGETIIVGQVVGRVRAMSDDRGRRIPEAPPAKPVEVLGLPEVPEAGDRFMVVDDERLAKQLAQQRAAGRRRVTMHPPRMSLEDLHRRITEGRLKELRLILKADVQGSLEAIVQSLEKLDVAKEGIHLLTLHAGVGDIGEADVMLAAASDAIVVGFHVGIEPKVQVLAAVEGVDLHIYQIIYELVGAMKAAIEGLLEPEVEETFIGRAEVRRVFELSKGAFVAGCMVTKGSLRRDCAIRVIRGSERIAQGPMAGLRRVKDDVREVQEGVECGVRLEGSVTLQVGDLLEAWDVKKVARKLA